MAYIFISDGGPEAEEYDNNYFRYDESNTDAAAKIKYIMEHCDTQDPEIRAKLTAICKESHQQRTFYNNQRYRSGWFSNVLNYFKQNVL